MKMSLTDQGNSRREFLRNATRYGALSVLAALSAAALRPGQRNQCRKVTGCSSCPILPDCDLPKATQEKSAREAS